MSKRKEAGTSYTKIDRSTEVMGLLTEKGVNELPSGEAVTRTARAVSRISISFRELTARGWMLNSQQRKTAELMRGRLPEFTR